MLEKKILTNFKHPNIVDLIGTFQDEDSLFFVLEFCKQGDLFGLISTLGKLPMELVKAYGAQIVTALEYIHANKIFHRDLKPQNIMLSDDLMLKLIDFGDSHMVDEKDVKEEVEKLEAEDELENGGFVEFRAHDSDEETESSPHYRGTFVGTPLYVAPEMLKETISGHFTDLWALGCILFEMATGDVPFRGDTDYATFELIMDRAVVFPDGFDPDLKDMIKRLLHLDPIRRLGAGEPGSGNTYEELKGHAFFESIDWSTISSDLGVPTSMIKEAKEKLEAKKKKIREDIFSDSAKPEE